MHRSGKREVSLRGSSAKEVSRDALLNRVAAERAARSQARRAATAALLIQRVWRSRARAAIWRAQTLQAWDERWASFQQSQVAVAVLPPGTPSPSGREISAELLRPLLQCLRRRIYSGGKGPPDRPTSQPKRAPLQTKPEGLLQEQDSGTWGGRWHLDGGAAGKDALRLGLALSILLRSMGVQDAVGNFCGLALSTPQDQEAWQLQSKKLLSLCSHLLLCAAGAAPDAVPQPSPSEAEKSASWVPLTSSAVRAAISLTDCSTWAFLKQEGAQNKADAARHVHALQWALVESDPTAFPAALRAFVLGCCPPSPAADGERRKDALGGLSRDSFLLLMACLPLALRPLLPSEAPQQEGRSRRSLEEEAARQLALNLYSVPLLTWRIPAPLLRSLCSTPAFLRVLKALRQWSPDANKALEPPQKLFGSNIPSSAWALANVVALGWDSHAETGQSQLPLAAPLTELVKTVAVLLRRTEQDLVEWRVNHLESVAPREGGRLLGDGLDDKDDEDERGTGVMDVDPLFFRDIAPLADQSVVNSIVAAILPDTAGSHMPAGSLESSVTVKEFASLYSLLLGLLQVMRPAKVHGSSTGMLQTLSALALLNALSFTSAVLPALWRCLAPELRAPGFAMQGQAPPGPRRDAMKSDSGSSKRATASSPSPLAPSSAGPSTAQESRLSTMRHQSEGPSGEAAAAPSGGTFWERARQGLFASIPRTPSTAGRRWRRGGGQTSGPEQHEGGAMDVDGGASQPASEASPALPWGGEPAREMHLDPQEEAPGQEFGLVENWLSLFSSGGARNAAGSAATVGPRQGATALSEEEVGAVAQWDVESEGQGILSAVKGSAGAVLELFCRAYAHLLLVLDDEEFFSEQVPFTLTQQRSIAATLNSLVYNAILAKHTGSAARASAGYSPAAGVPAVPASLLEAAAKCLRALYDRDSRRAFCPPLLWRAPALGHPLTASAAAKALRGRSDEEPESDGAEKVLRALLGTSALQEVLQAVPHVLSFEDRVVIFRELVAQDRAKNGILAGPGMAPLRPVLDVKVRRDRLVEDGFALLGHLGRQFKGRIRVTFVDAFGVEEMGIDQGGLFKEFLTDLAKAAFNPNYGLFAQTDTEEGLLYPSAAAAALEDGLPMVEFLGRIVGKALYEGILLEYSFAPLFISKIMGRYAFLDELCSLDSELYRNLMYLKHYEGDAQDLALDFTLTEEVLGEHRSVPLVPNGAAISVTSENKRRYIHAVADYKLNKQMQRVTAAFVAGLSDLIHPVWLSIFSPREFNQLLSGGDEDVDVADLRAHTVYSGGYSETDRTVRHFWEVLGEFSREEKRELLKFVTSCSRPPLLGFRHLQPPFTLHKGVNDEDFLPSAATCVNTLKLPTYRNATTLRSKLKYAIKSRAGFDFS